MPTNLTPNPPLAGAERPTIPGKDSSLQMTAVDCLRGIGGKLARWNLEDWLETGKGWANLPLSIEGLNSTRDEKVGKKSDRGDSHE